MPHCGLSLKNTVLWTFIIFYNTRLGIRPTQFVSTDWIQHKQEVFPFFEVSHRNRYLNFEVVLIENNGSNHSFRIEIDIDAEINVRSKNIIRSLIQAITCFKYEYHLRFTLFGQANMTDAIRDQSRVWKIKFTYIIYFKKYCPEFWNSIVVNVINCLIS